MLLKTALTTGAAACVLAASAAAADAATLEVEPLDKYELMYQGSAGADTVTVTPSALGFTISSSESITVAQNADFACGPSATTVTCTMSGGLTEFEVHTHQGDDVITTAAPSTATPVKAALQVFGGDDDDTYTGSSFSARVYAGAGDDEVNGGSASEGLYGEEGADSMLGGSGADRLEGGAGDDFLGGDAGSDEVFGAGGADKLYGGAEDDVITPGEGNDPVVHGGGNGPDGDTVSYWDRNVGVVVDLGSLDGTDGVAAEGEDAVAFENVLGSMANDTLLGGDGPSLLDGKGGDNVLWGRGGDDELTGGQAIKGGPGDDEMSGRNGTASSKEVVLEGGPGNDDLYSTGNRSRLDGGTGADTMEQHPGGQGVLSYAGRTDDVEVDLNQTGAVQGGAADDIDGLGPLETRDQVKNVWQVVTGEGDDTIVARTPPTEVRLVSDGGGGSDHLIGSAEQDDLVGGPGNDTLEANGGHDELLGGEGDDRLKAADGDWDRADCGTGTDDAQVDKATIDTWKGCEMTPFTPKPVAQTPQQDLGPHGGTGGPTPIWTPTPAPPATPGTATVRAGTTEALGSMPALRVTRKVRRIGKRTRFTKLRVRGGKPGSRLVVRCKAPRRGACPFRVKTLTLPSTGAGVDLARVLRRRALPAGTRLTISSEHVGFRPSTATLTTRARKAPRLTRR